MRKLLIAASVSTIALLAACSSPSTRTTNSDTMGYQGRPAETYPGEQIERDKAMGVEPSRMDRDRDRDRDRERHPDLQLRDRDQSLENTAPSDSDTSGTSSGGSY